MRWSTPRRPPVRDTEELTGDTYGPLKVACEDDVVARYGSRATIVRPSKVAGPHDPSDMFTYWVRRAARGGRVALPGDPHQPVQVIDVRDLARPVVQLLVDDRPGAFHAVEIVPVLPAAQAPPLFPLIRTNWPAQQRSPAKARAAGLPATPLAVTAADVLAWDRQRGQPPLAHGYTVEQEAVLLAQAVGS